MLRDLHPAISRSDKCGYQVHGAELFRWAQEEDGFKVDNQLAHETLAPPRFDRLRLERVCALINSKESLTSDRLRVAGCKTRVANAKEIAL